MAGHFVQVRGWERLGFARLRDYAVERLGLSARQLQDLAHVDGRLRELPQIESALVSGELSWTRARLLCRVATPEDESDWLALASRLTARALAKEVRQFDVGSVEAGAATAEETDEDGMCRRPRTNIQVRCTPAVRAKWQHACTVARWVAGENLPRWECAEAIAAEVLSAMPVELDLGEDRSEKPADESANGCARGATRRRLSRPSAAPAALPAFLRSIGDGLDRADAFELDARLRRAVALEARLEAEISRWLVRVADRRLHVRHGFASFDEYARERLGLSPRKAKALLRLERAGRHCPGLLRGYRSGHLSWVRAHTLVSILAIPGIRQEPRWQRAWLQRAERVTVRQLEHEVESALVLHASDAEAFARCGGLGVQTGAPPTESTHLPRTSEPAEETAWFLINAPREVARFIRAVLCTVRRQLGVTEGEAFGAMCDHVFAAWRSADEYEHDHDQRYRHRVFERDGWRCTIPGCSSYRNLHDHHIVFRSAGGGNELENRTSLCAWHHLRAVHAGTVRITGRAPAKLRFELGVRPGGRPLATYEGEVLC